MGRIVCPMISLLFGLSLAACQTDVSSDGTPVIRSQAEADAYNATIDSQSDFVYCTEEAFTGSKIARVVCKTVAQRQQSASSAKANVVDTLLAIPIN